MKLKSGMRFIVVSLLPTIPLILLVVFITFVAAPRCIEEAAFNTLESVDQIASFGINELMIDARASLKGLTTDKILQSTAASHEEKREVLKEFHKDHPIFSDITLCDLKGHAITSVHYSYRGEWIGKDFYKKAVHGKEVVSNAYTLINPFKVIFSIALPTSNEKEKHAWVIVGQIDAGTIAEFTNSIHIGLSGYVMIVNDDGLAIAHPDNKYLYEKVIPDDAMIEMNRNSSGSMQIANVYGWKEYIAYTTLQPHRGISFPRWFIVAVHPVDEALFSISMLKYLSLLAIAIACSLAIILGMGFHRKTHLTK